MPPRSFEKVYHIFRPGATCRAGREPCPRKKRARIRGLAFYIMIQSRGFMVGTSARQMLYRTMVFHISPFRHSSRTISDASMPYRFISSHLVPCVCCSNCCSGLGQWFYNNGILFGILNAFIIKVYAWIVKPSIFNYIPISCEIIHFCAVSPIETLLLQTIFYIFIVQTFNLSKSAENTLLNPSLLIRWGIQLFLSVRPFRYNDLIRGSLIYLGIYS